MGAFELMEIERLDFLECAPGIITTAFTIDAILLATAEKDIPIIQVFPQDAACYGKGPARSKIAKRTLVNRVLAEDGHVEV